MLFLAPLALAAPWWMAIQDPAPAAAQPERPVADAWERYQEASRAYADANGEALAALRGAGDEEAARAAYREAMAPHRERMEAARIQFRDAFERSTRESWDEMEAGMLAEGLHLMAEHALEHDPEMAGKAWEELLRRCPRDERVARVRGSLLPNAYLALGHPETARRKIEELLATAPEEEVPGLRRFVGDTHAMAGELDRARVVYREARAAIPPDREEERPHRLAARALDLRLHLVGRSMPELHVQELIGGPRTRGAVEERDLRGDGVLLLDFCATWCEPSREVIPHLDALARQYREHGLRVVGATRHHESGFLPDGPRELDEGRQIDDIAEEEFANHLREFRERAGVSYPFVVVPEEDVRVGYAVTGVPTFVLVGKDGRVRFVHVGAGSERVLDAAVRLALAD